MDIIDLLRELIDTRTFSNLWFWIGLAVLWSMISHWVVGVPYDMIVRAARRGGDAETDLNDMAHIHARRILYHISLSGYWMLGVVVFVLTSLGMFGFYYDQHLSQALFLMLFPSVIVGLLSIRTSRMILDQNLVDVSLRKRLLRHRLQTQVVGIIAIFITAMWGMFQNMSDALPLQLKELQRSEVMMGQV